MPRMPVFYDKDLLRLLERYGCKEIRVTGSHHILLCRGKTRPLAIHGQDVKRGSLIGILDDLGIDRSEFFEFAKNN